MKKRGQEEGSLIFRDLFHVDDNRKTSTLSKAPPIEVDSEHLDIFPNKEVEQRNQNNKVAKRLQEDDEGVILHTSEFAVVRPPYRQPKLESLTIRALNKFKKELEASEDIRLEFNSIHDLSKQISQPQPIFMVPKKLWSHILVEIREMTSQNIDSFHDITFEHFESWLKLALVPKPNNRPFFQKLETDLSNAWSRSYFYGFGSSLGSCLPFLPRPEQSLFTPLDFDMESEQEKNQDKHQRHKHTSTASSISAFSLLGSFSRRFSISSSKWNEGIEEEEQGAFNESYVDKILIGEKPHFSIASNSILGSIPEGFSAISLNLESPNIQWNEDDEIKELTSEEVENSSNFIGSEEVDSFHHNCT